MSISHWWILLVVLISSGYSNGFLLTGNADLANRGRSPVYRIAAVQIEPFLFANYTGYVTKLMQDILDAAGINAILIPLSSGKAGVWNELIEKVANEDYDMAVGPVTSTPLRNQYVDFITPIMTVRTAALLRRGSGVQRVDDLVDWGIPLGTLRDSAMEETLRDSPRYEFRELWSLIQDRNKMATVEGGLDKVRQGNFAFLIDDVIARYLVGRAPGCDLKMTHVWSSEDPRPYGIAVRKTLPVDVYTNLLYSLLQLHEDLTTNLLYRKYFLSGEHCPIYP